MRELRCNVPEATEESFNHMLNVNLRGTVFAKASGKLNEK